ncbi:MAG: MgtC/SapB family protein [Alphaproteobacteria bacterium]|nr:MgtC/SapB family protein [Alphaproteobacteria bacterium]MCW5739223.1 MgtC/SapB family protein [Alphaproteobacteria bacterium]
MSDFADLMLRFAGALAIGLLVGAERERRKGEDQTHSPAGVRTFAIASLSGAVALEIGGVPMLIAASVAIFGLTAVAYFHSSREDPGLTTEAALVAMPSLGALSLREPAAAGAIAVVMTVLLAFRSDIHHFVRSVLTADELRDGLVLGAAALVILPLMPDRPMGPWEAINPRTIWLIVILVMAIGALGHVAVRIVGPRFGLPIAGFAGGFVSSTATIAAMGERATKEPQSLRPIVAGAVLSTVATVVQLAIIVAAFHRPTLIALAIPLALAGAVAVLYGLFFAWHAARAEEPRDVGTDERAFNPLTALLLAAIVAIVLLASAALKEWLGEAGLVIAAAAGGLADAHAGAASVTSMAASGRISPQEASWPILAAFTSNSVVKCVIAATYGGATYASRVVPGVILVSIAAWAGMFVPSF